MATTLVVMAAGRGSRFGGMKQVAGIGPAGASLFDYAVYDAVRAGFDDAVFVVSGESLEAVEAHVEGGCGRHVKVRFVVQEAEGRDKPWGTGHAVLCACTETDGAFGVVNSDDFYGPRSFERLGQELAADGGDHVLVAFRLRDCLSSHGGVSRGVCEVEDGLLASIAELHEVAEVDGTIRSREGVPLTGDELISTNLWGFRPSFCNTLAAEFERFLAEQGDDPDAEFMIGSAVESLGRYGGEQVRAEIATMVDAGRYPTPLWP